MYELTVRDEFSAAHRLRGYRGKCEELHGHNWKVEVTAASDKLDRTGMVIDFRKLKDSLRRILKELDHAYLNILSYFRKINPTSENIAKYIYKRLIPKLRTPNLDLSKVKVWESENSSATYYEE